MIKLKKRKKKKTISSNKIPYLEQSVSLSAISYR